MRGPSESRELVVHDVGAGLTLYVLTLGPRESARLAGHRLLFRANHSVWSTALDGGDRVQLWTTARNTAVERILPSPDSSQVALNIVCQSESCPGFERPNHVYVVSAATGEWALRLDQDVDLPSDFRGTAAPIGWIDDGRVVLGGHLHADAGARDAAVAAADGSVEVFRYDPADPLGAAWDRALGLHRPEVSGHPECVINGFAGLWRIALTEPETGVVLNAIERDAPAFGLPRVHPSAADGPPEEVLVLELLADQATRAEWASNVARGRCPTDSSFEPRDHPSQWWIFSADGSPPQRVANELEVYRRWLGDRLITYACGGSEALRVSVLERVEGCDPRFGPVELRLGGVAIGEAIRPTVLGWIELDPGEGSD